MDIKEDKLDLEIEYNTHIAEYMMYKAPLFGLSPKLMFVVGIYPLLQYFGKGAKDVGKYIEDELEDGRVAFEFSRAIQYRDTTKEEINYKLRDRVDGIPKELVLLLEAKDIVNNYNDNMDKVIDTDKLNEMPEYEEMRKMIVELSVKAVAKHNLKNSILNLFGFKKK